MKLSKLSQRLLAPIAASFTLLSGPAFAKTEIDGKSFALGLQASLECNAERANLPAYEVRDLTKDLLKENGYGHLYTWLNTSNGEKAVSITKDYLDSNCTISDKNAIKTFAKVYKYF